LRRRRSIALAALGATLLVAGCGSDQGFIDDYNKATKPLTSLNRDIGGTVGGATKASNKTISKQFDSLADRADGVNADLAALSPPDNAKGAFSDLRGALHDATRDLREAAKAAKSSDSRGFQSATESLSKHGEQISQAENALQKKVQN
jgi:hypothetical protein